MSYPPNFTTEVRDGQMALAGELSVFPVIFGVSSLGTVATVYVHTDGNAALDELGHGPLTEQALPVIEEAGGAILVKTSGSVAAVNGTVTPTRVAASVGTITLSGTAYRDMRCRVEIRETTAALGSGKFRYTLDNANTWSEDITIPTGGVYAVPDSGISITFVLNAGTPDFEDGDIFTWDSTAAHYNSTNLTAAFAALIASSLLIGRKIEQVYYTGIAADAATSATNAVVIAAQMASLENLDHFARAMMDGGSTDTTINYLANLVAVFADTRVAPHYGRAEIPTKDPIAGLGMPYVSGMVEVARRAAGAEISENLGRVLSGPLRAKATTLQQDEGKSPAFTFDNKTLTLRTNRNREGVYVTYGFLKSPAGSDFIAWDYGRTLDRACSFIVRGLAPWTLSKLRPMTDGTGYLDPRDAARVKKSVDILLFAAMDGPTIDGLPKHVAGQEFVVATAYDFVSTRILKATYRQVPNVAIEGGEIVVGLTRQLEAA